MVARLIFALLFIGWVGEAPIEIDSVTYSGLWRSPFVVFAPLLSPIPGIRLVPWQLLLIALLPVAFAIRGGSRQRSREVEAAILVSLGSLAITFLWGWIRGGGAYQAYFQLWRFLAALALAYLLMSAIRSPRDLRALSIVVIVAAVIRATLVMYFYWAHVHGKVNPLPEYMTNHDDSLLFVTAILVAGAWAAIKGGKGPWIVLGLLTPWLFYAMVLNARRLAWVELAFAMVVIYFMIGPSPLRRRIHRWTLAVAPILLLYVIVGWGQGGAFFAPVKAFSTAGSDADASSLARLEEIRNLLYTLSAYGNPLLGTGWGLPYQKLQSVYANYPADWALAFYTPHNSLLGLTAFSGLVGILGIWGVVPVGAYLAARSYRRSDDPVLRTSALVAAGMLAGYGVHCYGDIGFQSFQCGLLLGVALATAGKVSAWTASRSPAKVARAPVSPSPATLRGAGASVPQPAAARTQLGAATHPSRAARVDRRVVRLPKRPVGL